MKKISHKYSISEIEKLIFKLKDSKLRNKIVNCFWDKTAKPRCPI